MRVRWGRWGWKRAVGRIVSTPKRDRDHREKTADGKPVRHSGDGGQVMRGPKQHENGLPRAQRDASERRCGHEAPPAPLVLTPPAHLGRRQPHLHVACVRARARAYSLSPGAVRRSAHGGPARPTPPCWNSQRGVSRFVGADRSARSGGSRRVLHGMYRSITEGVRGRSGRHGCRGQGRGRRRKEGSGPCARNREPRSTRSRLWRTRAARDLSHVTSEDRHDHVTPYIRHLP